MELFPIARTSVLFDGHPFDLLITLELELALHLLLTQIDTIQYSYLVGPWAS